jgi:hypothetical protein
MGAEDEGTKVPIKRGILYHTTHVKCLMAGHEQLALPQQANFDLLGLIIVL